MARRKCCIPYCHSEDYPSKQFFKLNEKEYDKVKEICGQLNPVMYCCQNHYDLGNDTKNFIKYKHLPGLNLLLRPGALPHKRIPKNVCRVCLNLIYKDDDFVNVSEQNNAEKSEIVKTCLPELDLSLTFDPIVCYKCFKSLEAYYQIKKQSLKTEVTVVKCVKEIAKKQPNKLIATCSINLFEHYGILKNIKAEIDFKEGLQVINITQSQPESNKTQEEIAGDIKDEQSRKKPTTIMTKSKTDSDISIKELEVGSRPDTPEVTVKTMEMDEENSDIYQVEYSDDQPSSTSFGKY